MNFIFFSQNSIFHAIFHQEKNLLFDKKNIYFRSTKSLQLTPVNILSEKMKGDRQLIFHIFTLKKRYPAE